MLESTSGQKHAREGENNALVANKRARESNEIHEIFSIYPSGIKFAKLAKMLSDPEAPMLLNSDVLRELTLVLKIRPESPFYSHLRNLTCLVFKNLERLFEKKDPTVYSDWLESSPVEERDKLIAFLMLNCARLSEIFKADLPPLSASNWGNLLKLLNNSLLKGSESQQFIGMAFQALNQMSANRKVMGTIDEKILEEVLQKATTFNLDFQSLSRILRKNHWEMEEGATIKTDLINTLLGQYVTKPDLSWRNVKDIMFALCSWAEKRVLVGTIETSILDKLFGSPIPEAEIDQKVIRYIWRQLGTLATYMEVPVDLTNFFQLITEQSRLEPSTLNHIFLGLSELTKNNSGRGVEAKTLENCIAKIPSQKLLEPLTIHNIFLCWDTLVRFRNINGMISRNVVDGLLRRALNSTGLTAQHLHIIFTGLGCLAQADQLEGFDAILLEKLLVKFNELNSSDLLPGDAAHLIKYLVFFKQYAKALTPFFTALCGALKPFEHYPGHLRKQLQANINDLQHCPQWQALLRSSLKLPSITSKDAQVNEVVKKVTATPKKANVRLDKHWQEARSNQVFDAIAKKDLRKLRRILELLTRYQMEYSTGRTSHQHQDNTPLSSLEKLDFSPEDPRAHIYELIFAFFNIEKTALEHLISTSRQEYFQSVLEACTPHIRYQLATFKRLDPILQYLPPKELQSFVDQLLGPFHLYIDHMALLQLIDALTIRLDEHPEEEKIIRQLQTQLIDRGLESHKNHCHVEPRLQQVKTNLVKKRLILLDNERAVIKPVAHQEQRPKTAVPPKGKPAIDPSIRTYQYTSEDIQAILTLRVGAYPQVHVLAAAQISSTVSNNTVGDVLVDFLKKSRPTTPLTILMPICVGEHWVGLKFTLEENKLSNLLYFNSLPNAVADEQRIESIKSNLLKRILIPNDMKIIQIKGHQQDDDCSCGPYLIENFYCSIKGAWWPKNLEDEMVTFRLRHIDLLKTEKPSYYETFKKAHKTNNASLPSVSQQSQRFFPPVRENRREDNRDLREDSQGLREDSQCSRP